MLVCWNERLIPMRQMRCGAAPVMSRPASHTRPASGRRCPVMMLNRVDFPAPLGPMTAAICRRLAAKLTPATAANPSKDFLMSCTSSMVAISRLELGRPPPPTWQAGATGMERAEYAARKGEQQHDQDRAEDERPILGVRGDLLVQHDQHQGSPARRSSSSMVWRVSADDIPAVGSSSRRMSGLLASAIP